MAKKEISYNEALQELKKIVIRIEEDEPDVDELSAMVKKATHLVKYCRNKLKETQEGLTKDLESLN